MKLDVFLLGAGGRASAGMGLRTAAVKPFHLQGCRRNDGFFPHIPPQMLPPFCGLANSSQSFLQTSLATGCSQSPPIKSIHMAGTKLLHLTGLHPPLDVITGVIAGSSGFAPDLPPCACLHPTEQTNGTGCLLS